MSKHKERILVVDDDQLIQNMLKVYLEIHGYEIEVVASGDAAVELFEEKRGQHGFDLMIIDQVMPGLDGLTAFQKIQKIDNCLAAVMLTGYPTINLAIRFIQLGGTNVLSKPFDPQSGILVVAIQEALNYKRIKNAQSAVIKDDHAEPLVFLDEDSQSKMKVPQIATDNSVWKVLIIDDDEAAHQATRLALDTFLFDGRVLLLYSAYSVDEAKSWLNDNSDVALVIVDANMETEFAGFDVIQHIREVMGNRLVRIIFRTDQLGDLPEQKVVLEQEIDGFLTKQDVSSQRLTVMVTTILRAYRDLLIPERQRQQMITELEVANHVKDDLQRRIELLEQQLSAR